MEEENAPEEEFPLLSEVVEKEESATETHPVNGITPTTSKKDSEGLLAAEVLMDGGDEALADPLLGIPPFQEERVLKKERLVFDLSATLLFLIDFWLVGFLPFGSSLFNVTIIGLAAILCARMYSRVRGGCIWSIPNYYSGDPQRPVPSIVFRILGWLLLVTVFLISSTSLFFRV